jgi:uncharacterized protein (DUF1919 family)
MKNFPSRCSVKINFSSLASPLTLARHKAFLLLLAELCMVDKNEEKMLEMRKNLCLQDKVIFIKQKEENWKISSFFRLHSIWKVAKMKIQNFRELKIF